MSRVIAALILALALALALASAAGCSSAPPPNEMAPTPRLDPAPAAPEARAQEKPAPLPVARTGDGIAARVNNEIITWKDVNETIKEIKPADVTPELRKSKLREMAEERMFLQAAKKNNLLVTEQELDEAQRRDVKMYGSEEEFERVKRIRYGTTAVYREDKRKQLLIYKLYRHLLQQSWTNPGANGVGLMLDFVSPDEIREYYLKNAQQFEAIERVTFLRIGMQFTNDRGEETSRMVAESVLRKLEEGGEFTMLAFFYSDVRRAKDFRDARVSRKDIEAFYSPETVKYLFETMKEGDVSPIIKDGKTLNIFKMDEKIDQKKDTFDEAQIKIRNMLENKYREENRRKLRDHLRKEAYLWPPDLFDFE